MWCVHIHTRQWRKKETKPKILKRNKWPQNKKRRVTITTLALSPPKKQQPNNNQNKSQATSNLSAFRSEMSLGGTGFCTFLGCWLFVMTLTLMRQTWMGLKTASVLVRGWVVHFSRTSRTLEVLWKQFQDDGGCTAVHSLCTCRDSTQTGYHPLCHQTVCTGHLWDGASNSLSLPLYLQQQ